MISKKFTIQKEPKKNLVRSFVLNFAQKNPNTTIKNNSEKIAIIHRPPEKKVQEKTPKKTPKKTSVFIFYTPKTGTSKQKHQTPKRLLKRLQNRLRKNYHRNKFRAWDNIARRASDLGPIVRFYILYIVGDTDFPEDP
jgi:hypothetical protein